MKSSKILLSFLFSLSISFGYSQFTTTVNTLADTLALYLAGPGVVITNATLNCDTNSSGLFENAPAGLGISDGVLLTTGSVLDVDNAASFQISNATPTTNDGDADLDSILSSQGLTYFTNDACALEFDIEVTGDSLKFDYVFSSEEYPEGGTGNIDDYVCSINDIFAFFITGTNPFGAAYNNQNVALIPGTTHPVSINSVNDGTEPVVTNTAGDTTCFNNFTNYYNGFVAGLAYDGSTNVLTAAAATIPCQTYHFKLVIADGSDQVFDSGVFLAEGSFSSNAVVVGASSVLGEGFDEAIEGCVDGVFNLEIDTPYPISLYVHYDISGTATNGVDYAQIFDSVLVPAGDTIVSIFINVISDTISEGTETVILTPYNICGSLAGPSTLEIIDDIPNTASISDTILCSPVVVTVSATGGQFYKWSDSTLLQFPDSSSTPTINPVTQNTTYYLEGELGTCFFYDTLSVQVSQTNPTFHFQDISCAGANDGMYWIELNDSATVPVTYNFPFVPTTDSFVNNITAGSFQLATATDALGCSFTGPFHIFNDAAGMNFGYDTIPISCGGAANGKLCIYNVPIGTYTAVIDTNGVQYDSVNFAINMDTFCMSSFGPGSYDVTLTNDTSLCTASFIASYTDPTGMAFSYDTTNISCANADDGSICVYNVQNGNYQASVVYNGVAWAPINFVINSDTFCFDNLAFGDYDIHLENITTQCVADFSVNLTEPDTLITGITVMGTGLCAGGSIDSLVSTTFGGSTPYNYNWSNGLNTPNISGIPYGNYYVNVTDDNGCMDSAYVSIISPTPMFLEIKQDSVLCFGGNTGSAFIDSISGGAGSFTYSWDDALSQLTPTANNLSSGQYILTATDINGCLIMDTINVLEPTDSISITLSSYLINCFGGDTCIDAVVSGGISPYSYSWNSGDTIEDICGKTAGTYTLTVTDANGCTNSKTIVVSEVPEINLTVDSVNIICYGLGNGTATVTAMGGSGSYNYLWDDALAQSTSTASNLVPGTYTVVVSDQLNTNCSKSISVNIEQPTDSLDITLNNLTDVLCNGASTGSIDVDVTGGTSPFTFNWSNSTNNEDIIGVQANSYTLTVTDSNLCVKTFTDIVNEPLPLSIVVNTPIHVSCFNGNDGAIDITVSGGVAPYNYSWDTGDTIEDLTGLSAGTYILTVTDSNSCEETQTVTISEPNNASITFTYSDFNGENISCNGASDGTVTANILGGSGPYSYTWSNSANSNPLTGVGPGIEYSVTIVDANLCSYTDTAVALTEPSVLTATSSYTDISCVGFTDGTATATPAGGIAPYNYLWSDPLNQTSMTATGLAPNTYNCQITDANGCTETVIVTIGQPSGINVTIETDSVECWGESNGSITITASGGNGSGYEYSIDGGTTFQTSNIFTDLTSGVYSEITVKQIGITGCNAPFISATVSQPDPMFISINPNDTTIQLQQSVPLEIIVDPATGYTGNTSYTSSDINGISWSPTNGLSCSDCLNPTALTFDHENEYIAMVTYSPFNCEATANVFIHVENNLLFFIPNAFSPNGDGLNDEFKVYGDGLKDSYIAVYNRIGEKVFETSVQSKSWDGKFKDILQEPGVFSYTFVGKYLDDQEINLKGSFTLIR